MFAPVWSLSQSFILRNSVVKSLQKIWPENAQKRRPRESSIEHGEKLPSQVRPNVPSTNQWTAFCTAWIRRSNPRSGKPWRYSRVSYWWRRLEVPCVLSPAVCPNVFCIFGVSSATGAILLRTPNGWKMETVPGQRCVFFRLEKRFPAQPKSEQHCPVKSATLSDSKETAQL